MSGALGTNIFEDLPEEDRQQYRNDLNFEKFIESPPKVRDHFIEFYLNDIELDEAKKYTFEYGEPKHEWPNMEPAIITAYLDGLNEDIHTHNPAIAELLKKSIGQNMIAFAGFMNSRVAIEAEIPTTKRRWRKQPTSVDFRKAVVDGVETAIAKSVFAADDHEKPLPASERSALIDDLGNQVWQALLFKTASNRRDLSAGLLVNIRGKFEKSLVKNHANPTGKYTIEEELTRTIKNPRYLRVQILKQPPIAGKGTEEPQKPTRSRSFSSSSVSLTEAETTHAGELEYKPNPETASLFRGHTDPLSPITEREEGSPRSPT